MKHLLLIAAMAILVAGGLATPAAEAARGYDASRADAPAPASRLRRHIVEGRQQPPSAYKLAPALGPHGNDVQSAARRNGRDGQRLAQRGGEAPRVSLDQAVAKVRSQYGGKVIRAETRNVDGRPVHYVKILSAEGRVRTVRVDGRSGRIQ